MMKKILLFCAGFLLTGMVNSQVIFSGISPASIQGNYEMTYGEVTGGWGSPDLLDPNNSVQDTLVLYDDANNWGCEIAGNASEIAGHIAILYRAECEFGLKTANAEAAGAIACIIINNVPGSPVGMAPGDFGINVTIPVVMISDQDGATLLNAMQNDPVVVFIGNKNGYYEDDLGMTIDGFLRPQFSSLPLTMANSTYTDTQENDIFRVNLGGTVYNYGSNDQNEVTLNVTISRNGTEVYNETSDVYEMPSGDSVYISLPPYSPAQEWEEGYYTLLYTVGSDVEDQYDFDNVWESNFVIGSEFSYAYIDEATGQPNISSHNRVIDGASGDPIPYYSSCINFRSSNASQLAPKAISFSATKGSSAGDPLMTGEPILVQVLSYNDNFVDLNSDGFNNPIVNYETIMTQQYEYEGDYQDTIVTAEFDDNIIVPLFDNQRYLFCVTTFNEEVYLATDGKRDYTLNLDYYLQPLFPVEAGSGSINPIGFGAQYVPSISVKLVDPNSLGLNKEEIQISFGVYPSPANEVVNVDFKDNDVAKVELVNMMGQTVASQNVTNSTKVSFDVSGVDSGVYFAKVTLKDGYTQSKRFIVSH